MENKQVLKVTLPLPSSVNMIYGRNKYGSIYLKKEGKEYKKKAIKITTEAVKEQNWIKLKEDEYCYLDTIVYQNKRGRDNDNIYKLLQDSFTETGVVWLDDTLVWPRTQRSYIDSNNPRVEIIIYKSNTVGIFESKEEYKEFRNNNCDKCSKKSDGSERSCTIHKKILENRIIEEVTKDELNTWRCNKLKEKKIK